MDTVAAFSDSAQDEELVAASFEAVAAAEVRATAERDRAAADALAAQQLAVAVAAAVGRWQQPQPPPPPPPPPQAQPQLQHDGGEALAVEMEVEWVRAEPLLGGEEADEAADDVAVAVECELLSSSSEPEAEEWTCGERPRKRTKVRGRARRGSHVAVAFSVSNDGRVGVRLRVGPPPSRSGAGSDAWLARRAKDRALLPPGWTVEERHAAARSYRVFFGPNGEYAESLPQAWRGGRANRKARPAAAATTTSRLPARGGGGGGEDGPRDRLLERLDDLTPPRGDAAQQLARPRRPSAIKPRFMRLLGAAVEAGGGSRNGEDAAAATTHVAAAPEAVGSEAVGSEAVSSEMVSSEVEDAD